MPRLDRTEGRDGVSLPSLGRDAPLVGRDAELELVDAELRTLDRNGFRIVLVAGPAGVGKTRLIADALGDPSHDLTRLSARSYRWGETTSFGPWLEALHRHLRTGTEAGRGQLLDELASVLDRLSQERPVVIAMDDLHLADSSAWEALRYLARRLADAPIGVVATARPADLERRPIATEVLLGLADDGQLVRVDLEPLRRHEVAALAHELLRTDDRLASSFVPEPLVSWLMGRTLGHPLYVIGLLRALAEEGGDLAAPSLERTPATLRERIAVDLELLRDDDRRLLETLAVIGHRVELGALERITQRPADQLGDILERLVRSRLVVEHATGADLRFEIFHPVIADVIYESIGGARRKLLHRTVARTLRDDGQLGAAASHYARAGLRDDEAVDTLFGAMEQAGQRELYREALAIMSALLEVLPAGDERWARVLDSVTLRSEWVLSHLAEADAATAIAAMKRVVAVLREAGDPSRLATALFHLAAFESFGAGRLAASERTARESVRLFAEAGDVEGELLATNELAWTRGCAGDLAGHANLAEQVLQRATGAGFVHVAVQATGTAAYAQALLGRFGDARQRFASSVSLADRDGNSYRVAWGHAQAGYFLGAAGDLADAIAAGERSLAADPAAADALALEDLAHTYWLAGRLEDAATALERSAARRPVAGSRRRAWGSALAARLYAELGQRGRADTRFDRADATYDGGFLAWSAYLDWAAGFLAFVDGENETALARLGRAADRLQRIGAAALEPLVLADLSEVAAASGDDTRLGRTARRCAQLATEIDGALAGWIAATVGARDRLAHDEPAAAHDAAAASAEDLAAAGYACLAATAWEVAGHAALAVDRRRATELLQQAAEGFDGCGAVWRRDRTLSLLTSLGSRGRRAAVTVQGPASLTPREREVARLSTKGLTAEQVGEELYIGKRTVETHLANIYAKLGVRSKRELIARADEFEL